MLKYGLTCTEGSGNKACTTFHNRIQCIDYTYPRLQQFERTRLFLIVRHGTFHRPSLNHSNRNIVSFLICQDCNRIFYLIITFRHDCFHGSRSFHRERSHHLQRLKILVHLPQPCGSLHFITCIYQRYEVPYTLFIQWICILSSFQENAIHFVKVILQTVVVFR